MGIPVVFEIQFSYFLNHPATHSSPDHYIIDFDSPIVRRDAADPPRDQAGEGGAEDDSTVKAFARDRSVCQVWHSARLIQLLKAAVVSRPPSGWCIAHAIQGNCSAGNVAVLIVSPPGSLPRLNRCQRYRRRKQSATSATYTVPESAQTVFAFFLMILPPKVLYGGCVYWPVYCGSRFFQEGGNTSLKSA